MQNHDLKKDYDVNDIKVILGVGRNSAYSFLEETYKNQEPFKVYKVGRLYRVPKTSFDAWLKGEMIEQD